MVAYLHEALDRRLKSGVPLRHEDIEAAVIEGAVHRLRPKLMTVCVVLASLIPILWETGVGADVMKPIAAHLVGGMITSTVHVLILVPVFFALMKERSLRRGTLQAREPQEGGSDRRHTSLSLAGPQPSRPGKAGSRSAQFRKWELLKWIP
jgi:Cu(I)/Ag(I) efflux system membrane protein CusA/SilA